MWGSDTPQDGEHPAQRGLPNDVTVTMPVNVAVLRRVRDNLKTAAACRCSTCLGKVREATNEVQKLLTRTETRPRVLEIEGTKYRFTKGQLQRCWPGAEVWGAVLDCSRSSFARLFDLIENPTETVVVDL